MCIRITFSTSPRSNTKVIPSVFEPGQDKGGSNKEYEGEKTVMYQIRLRGHLDKQWADWFASMTIALTTDGDTVLTGPIADQAALHGLLKKVRDLGLPLLSVQAIESNDH